MRTPSYAVDILAVSRLINGTIYKEKTEIINPWGVRRPPTPLNNAPGRLATCSRLLANDGSENRTATWTWKLHVDSNH